MAANKNVCDQAQLTAVELFCGIGGFRIASDELDIHTAWANDSKLQACQVYRDRFGGNTLIEGDITQVLDQIPQHDILTAGFPCQPFSQAGKKKGTRDPRGTLFNAIVEILERKRPRYFVLENVKRLLSMENGEHFATILSALSELDYLIEWRLLNAMHFDLPQNRQRTFIVGQRVDAQDVAPCATDVRLLNPEEGASFPLNLEAILSDQHLWTPFSAHASKFLDWGMAFHGRFLANSVPEFSGRSKVIPLREVLESHVPSEYDLTKATLARLKDNVAVNRFVQGVEVISNQGGGARMGYTIFGIDGVAPTLTASTSRHYERYRIGDKYRRLTPKEYARIQGFPDDHCAVISPYVQYELYGNAVPPGMARWVIGRVTAQRRAYSPEVSQPQTDLFANAA